MTYNEAVYEWFEKPMSLYIKTNPSDLIEYLNNHQKKVSIVDRNIDLKDVKKRANDPTYLKDTYVDITDEIDKKIEMLECHESQLKWMRDHDNIDFAEFVKTCARYRGLQCGVGYAEGFTQCLAWPKIKPMRLLP